MWLVGATMAMAATCPKELKALDASKGEAVASAFAAVTVCDLGAASGAFANAVKKTGDVDSLTSLTFAALDAGLTAPVVSMLDLIPDYAAREELARNLGGNCMANPQRVSFVRSLADLKGRAFVAWTGAIGTCPAPEIDSALGNMLATPPKSTFDDKYSAVVDLYARRTKSAGLPMLEQATTAALDGGPVAILIEGMQKAVTPDGIGAKPTEADRDALVASLGRVGANANPTVANSIAQTMIKVGAESQAVALLPKIYPTKVQAGGGFLYGLAAIEQCDEAMVVHYATVSEPGKRWSVQADAAAQANAFKRKLKCGADLRVQVSAEPVASAEEVTAWAENLASATEGAKLKAEKPITLP
jgi:hypothetical protein